MANGDGWVPMASKPPQPQLPWPAQCSKSGEGTSPAQGPPWTLPGPALPQGTVSPDTCSLLSGRCFHTHCFLGTVTTPSLSPPAWPLPVAKPHTSQSQTWAPQVCPRAQLAEQQPGSNSPASPPGLHQTAGSPGCHLQSLCRRKYQNQCLCRL